MGEVHAHAMEMADVRDVFVSGIHDIEELGSCSRFWLFVDCTPQGYDGPTERIIVSRIVIPDEILGACIRQSLLYWMRRVRKACGIPPLRVVK